MRRSLLPALLAAAVLPGAEGRAGDGDLWERIELSALAEVEWAGETAEGRNQKLELVLEPELEVELPWRMDLTAIGRLRADAFDRLAPGQPSRREYSEISRPGLVGTNAEVELRELYLEAGVGRAHLTLGKQQIVWGQADGLKVLDVVNPQDFREFILDEFEDSRIPLWAVNLEIPVRDLLVQLVWLPDPTVHEVPESDALYAFTAPALVPSPPPGLGVARRPLDVPRRNLSDSDGGVRVSTFWRGWDLTLNYLFQYDDFPVFFRSIAATGMGPVAVFEPRYRRTHRVGGTFSNAFGDLTLRGELVYSFDRYFSTEDLREPDGVKKMDEFAYVLGLDWYGFAESLVSLQVFQRVLAENPRGLVPERLRTTLTLLLRREFLHDTLIADFIWIHNIDDGDGLVRPKLQYELSDEVRVWAGFDVFYGTSRGIFGEFDERDRAVVGFEVGW